MIGKAKAISHGYNAIRYMTGESHNKRHKDRIIHLGDAFLPDGLDATAIWELMKLRCKGHDRMANTVIRIELSPPADKTRNYRQSDWIKLWTDYLREFDNVVLTDRQGRVVSPKTNLCGSRQTVWLHEDSESGIPHLHAAVCRVDEDGNTNNDRQIHIRALRAAERLARIRGWTTATDIHKYRLQAVTDDCLSVLRNMTEWSWSDYVKGLSAKGYEVCERRDSAGVLRGYSLRKGHLKYKASELGKGRNLMATKLEPTWRKLNEISVIEQKQPSLNTKGDTLASQGKPNASPSVLSLPDYHEYQVYKSGYIPYQLTEHGIGYRFYIPENIYRLFEDEFDYRECDNSTELIDKAVALFVGLVVPPDDVYIPFGGGKTDDKDWGRDPKDDDKSWAKRCIQAATHLIKPRKKTRGRGR